MRSLLLVLILTVLKSMCSVAVEAFVTWGLVELLIPSINVGFRYHYLFWFIVGFAVTFFRFRGIFRD